MAVEWASGRGCRSTLAGSEPVLDFKVSFLPA